MQLLHPLKINLGIFLHAVKLVLKLFRLSVCCPVDFLRLSLLLFLGLIVSFVIEQLLVKSHLFVDDGFFVN